MNVSSIMAEIVICHKQVGELWSHQIPLWRFQLQARAQNQNKMPSFQYRISRCGDKTIVNDRKIVLATQWDFLYW